LERSQIVKGVDNTPTKCYNLGDMNIMHPTLQPTEPKTCVLDDISRLEVVQTLWKGQPVLGVAIHQEGFGIVDYQLTMSILFGEGVMCRVFPGSTRNSTVYVMSNPSRVVLKETTIVVVDPEV
jgi:hypothetical protein